MDVRVRLRRRCLRAVLDSDAEVEAEAVVDADVSLPDELPVVVNEIAERDSEVLFDDVEDRVGVGVGGGEIDAVAVDDAEELPEPSDAVSDPIVSDHEAVDERDGVGEGVDDTEPPLCVVDGECVELAVGVAVGTSDAVLDRRVTIDA